MSEVKCQRCGHPAIMHAIMGQRCELCAGRPGLHASASALRRPDRRWIDIRQAERGAVPVPVRTLLRGLIAEK